ncbi:hypothetical protein LCGC14_2492290 [marine sediment metagenome]|uniref:PD-(D/E)XK endonuclease-like domain-containing protein n=1 Tax=marine sediment metagenome TaxID=412755 RepID=A0A0F9B4G3_9ZZZZ
MKYHRVTATEDSSYVTPGALQRHAEAGHWTESAVAEWLRLAGFGLRTHHIHEDGSPVLNTFGKPKQLGFYAAKDPETGQARIAGEIDGVITHVPPELRDMIPVPCLWESKKATAKKCKRFSSVGVEKADAKYYGQIQTCMAYLEIKHTLFSMLNLDNMEFYWELVPFDPLAAQHITDRAVKVLQSQTPYDLPRITSDTSDFRCKFCPYKEPCWNDPKEGKLGGTPLPYWINKGADSG